MIGKRFCRLVVIGRAGSFNHKRTWNCLCDCGRIIVAPTGSLNSGNTRSCGCLKLDIHTKHGQHKSRTYSLWLAMHNRCRLRQYRHYYGRIRVCEQWRDFSAFIADMGPAPNGMTLDRIDNSGHYEPSNCRWATRTTQVRNTRRRIEYEHCGDRHSLIEWSEILSMNYELLRGRIRRGWTFSAAIATH